MSFQYDMSQATFVFKENIDETTNYLYPYSYQYYNAAQITTLNRARVNPGQHLVVLSPVKEPHKLKHQYTLVFQRKNQAAAGATATTLYTSVKLESAQIKGRWADEEI
eukprot:scaffold28513_cov117-Skeletonema_dohrnii-CCMP3373.AAC.1